MFETKSQAIQCLKVISILFAILAIAAVGYMFKEDDEFTKRRAGFYPGRQYDDYSDKIFDFNGYLESIGATDIQRYVYTEGKDIVVMDLVFKLGQDKWKLQSYVFEGDGNTTISSKIVVENEDVMFSTTSENRGKIVADNDSPFWMDKAVFDVFHAASNPECPVTTSLRQGLDEDNCPFRGLGIAHYERDQETLDVIWHDDQGDRTIYDEGSDFLHY